HPRAGAAPGRDQLPGDDRPAAGGAAADARAGLGPRHDERLDPHTPPLARAAPPPMRERGWGRVMTIGSINQARPEPGLAVYAALKDAQKNLCLNLARQYAASGVNLNNLAPGVIATERNRWRRQDAAAWAEIARGVSATRGGGPP